MKPSKTLKESVSSCTPGNNYNDVTIYLLAVLLFFITFLLCHPIHSHYPLNYLST